MRTSGPIHSPSPYCLYTAGVPLNETINNTCEQTITSSTDTLFSAGTPPLHHPPPLSMEVTVYSIEDGKRLGLDYGLEGAGVGVWGGRLRGLPASTSSWSLWQQREAQHGKSGIVSAQQGLPNLQKRGEPPQMAPSMSTERPRTSGKLAHKKRSPAPHLTERQRKHAWPPRRAE